MHDTDWFKGQREKLVDSLKAKGITNEKVLQAILEVPRHLFVPAAIQHKAYEDNALPINCEQTISQPYTVAFQTQLLDVEENHKVLEIGTGSGYQAVILYHMGAKVYTIERIKALYNETKKRLNDLGYSGINMFYGDGTEGKEEFAPFDRIIVTAAASTIPNKLLKQLKINGKMVIPIGDHYQEMVLIVKKDEDNFELTKHGYFTFVPLIEGKI
ncbi:MAG: protein-L-isoaspartate(D-aspartate) O-methyltransferase [Bacteroidales bacterium]|nr:protein-L-isoaspartate(D-aspartate) O-methyltransferase [Bacteroidales bacterium]